MNDHKFRQTSMLRDSPSHIESAMVMRPVRHHPKAKVDSIGPR